MVLISSDSSAAILFMLLWQVITNGNSGIGGQHVPKKPKMTRHYPDTSAENVNPLIGSLPSPVASQVII
ncbi:hypothetical protein C5167_007746 [Papaver somniferum]|nr:hypothetical protein C5167_007746 [Papaver somniferum]